MPRDLKEFNFYFLYYTLYYSSNEAGHRQYLNNTFKTVRNGVQKQIQYYFIIL